MRVLRTATLALVMLAGIAARSMAGVEASVPAAASKAPLLAGIVNVDNDDIRFRTADGTTVFVDPLRGPKDELVVKSGFTKADLILITHRHGDHFQPGKLREYVKANPKVVIAGPADVVAASKSKSVEVTPVKPGEQYTMAGVSFYTMPAYFADGNSHPKDKLWVGYILKLDGTSYYVTGDTGPTPEMSQQKVDVVFPLLAGCGGNMDDALKMAQACSARLVVPVHHGNQQETINKFIGKLPQQTASAYYINGELFTQPQTPPADPKADKKEAK
jgi:L-ascorbate metabolism protein UlaG (beta-lactamase superfamily)